MSGEWAGTDREPTGTSGGASVTSGTRGLAALVVLGALLVYGAVELYANVGSIIADSRNSGRHIAAWSVWTTEGSSLLGWLVVIALIWRMLPHVLPPRRSWPVAVLILLVGAPIASAIHVGIMVVLREAIWAVQGLDYTFRGGLGGWPYELRKDVADYILFVLILLALRWYLERPMAQPAARTRHFTALDGARRVVLPLDEIDLIEAAGNYVEIHAADRKVLHRATLQAIEEELGHAQFARIHRSRLVRRAAVREVRSMQSGDFEVTLADGSTHRGSRRYRDRLD